MTISLLSTVDQLPGVGNKTALLLNKLDIFTLNDCIMCFPREYDDRRSLPVISALKQGEIKTIYGVIESTTEKSVKKGMHIIEAIIVDKSGRITATWFNQQYLLKILRPGTKVILKGKVDRSLFLHTDQLQVQHTEVIHSQKDYNESVGIIMPVYNLTAGIYQTQMRHIIKKALSICKPFILDRVPKSILDMFNFQPLIPSIYEIHYPKTVDGYKKARSRIVFNEFFYYQLRLEKQRIEHKKNIKSVALNSNNYLVKKYYKMLPYELTGAQKHVISEIVEDLKQPIAMNRLLQGDVGSGKTDVAIVTLLYAIENNLKGVLMAPTEILATQHFFRIRSFLDQIGVNCGLLKGKMRKKEKETTLEMIQSEDPCILIGTHALIENYINISSCGVVIIDEQHRFGVMQRIKLQNKGQNPHCLFMTATPIPRSFMLTCFGDLDKSIIDEMPPGRKPPKTTIVEEEYLPHVFQICAQRLEKKEQAYIVYPLVEESEKLDLKSAMEGLETIKNYFPSYNVGMIHGRMKPDEKENIMNEFKNNNINILVSTTVIEVGIDVSNATVMIIQHADRFGLSQLHQLRGRIGRGEKESLCFLVSNVRSELAKKRLSAMVETTNGFKIAEYDLNIRGPGDILGTKQTGIPSFKLADLIQDEKVLILARKVAKQILADDPHLANNDNRMIKEELSLFQDSVIGQHLN